ncbi:MAG: enoyl-CoA hydratase-related protein [Acidimicrobiales bacterium]
MSEALVLVDHPADHVARITLNRPERLNAMSIDLVIELWDALEAVAAENDSWVVILSGAGDAFCSGLDLKDYGIIPNIDGLQVGRIAQRSMRYYSRLVPKMRNIPQPIVASIGGVAFGGGMCLSLGADIRVASDHAVFNATGIVNGLASTEMGISFLLPRLIGAAHSNDLLLTGRRIDAEEALRMGLVSRVVPAADVESLAVEIAVGMTAFSPYGLAMTKETLWANLEVASLTAAIELEDRNQLMMGFTNNLPEAIRAFAQGREPKYTDEPRHDIWAPPES